MVARSAAPSSTRTWPSRSCARSRARSQARPVGRGLAGVNPAQQIVKIVNEELVAILGGDTRTLNLAKVPPTVILLAGLQGAGKTTLAGKLALHLKAQRQHPLLVAADLQRAERRHAAAGGR